MFHQRISRVIGCLSIALLTIILPAQGSSLPSVTSANNPVLEVYKSPTCGCCEEWISHLQSHGLKSTIHHPDDLNVIKKRYRISPQYQSCHTAVSPEGYVFEGHIPAQLITRFLTEKPQGAIGLAVPGMPVGSPGMEMGERFTPYDVLLLKSDGSSEVYIRITSLTQTF